MGLCAKRGVGGKTGIKLHQATPLPGSTGQLREEGEEEEEGTPTTRALCQELGKLNWALASERAPSRYDCDG